MSKGTTKGLRGLFKKTATLYISEENENDELLKKLRAWKLSKKQLD